MKTHNFLFYNTQVNSMRFFIELEVKPTDDPRALRVPNPDATASPKILKTTPTKFQGQPVSPQLKLRVIRYGEQ